MQSEGSRASIDSRSAAVGRDVLAGTTTRGSDPPATLPQMFEREYRAVLLAVQSVAARSQALGVPRPRQPVPHRAQVDLSRL